MPAGCLKSGPRAVDLAMASKILTVSKFIIRRAASDESGYDSLVNRLASADTPTRKLMLAEIVAALAASGRMAAPPAWQRAWEILSADPDDDVRTLALLDAIAVERVPRGDLSAFTVGQLAQSTDKQVLEKLQAVWGTVRSTPADRHAEFAAWRTRLDPGRPGVSAREPARPERDRRPRLPDDDHRDRRRPQAQLVAIGQPRRRVRAGAAEDEAIEAWLRSLPKPVGLFACYDIRGRQALEACRRAGLVARANRADFAAKVGRLGQGILADAMIPRLLAASSEARAFARAAGCL